jgi:NDP-sugar pyrophosphorylase family protein
MVQIVLPMSGVGKRFVAAGYVDPKPLIDVDGKPMIEHVMNLFPGENHVLAICNSDHLLSTDMRSVLRRLCPSVNIVSVPYRGKGPADAIMYASDFITDNDEVIVSYCDYGTRWDYKRFLQEMRSRVADGGIACYRGFHPHHLGPDTYAYVDEIDGWAVEVREKMPFTENKMNEYASNGTYYFRTGKILKEFAYRLMQSGKTVNGEFYVSMVYNHMIAAGMAVRVSEIDKMLQWGTPHDLRTYQMWHGCFQRPPQLVFPARGLTILPMAGRGSRFSMEGYTIPKPFLPISGQPMMVAALECLPQTAETRIITLKENEDVRVYIPKAKVFEIENVTNGQATTCMVALEDVADDTPITITACDNGALYWAARLRSLMENPTIDVVVWSFSNHPTSALAPQMYAWLDVDDDMVLQDVSIKKPFADKPNIHAIIGTMFFRRAGDFKAAYHHIVKHNIRTNGEFYVDNLLMPLVEMGKKVVVFPVDYYLGWGTPNDYKTFTYWQDHFTNADRSA